MLRIYSDALSNLVLAALHALAPPLVAWRNPMNLGRTWLLVHVLQSLLRFANAAELIPGHTICALLRQGGGPAFIMVVETVFGLFQQV